MKLVHFSWLLKDKIRSIVLEGGNRLLESMLPSIAVLILIELERYGNTYQLSILQPHHLFGIMCIIMTSYSDS